MILFHSLENIPCAINGLALGNVGIGVMFLRLGIIFDFLQYVYWIIYGFSLFGLLMMVIYSVRIVIWPQSWIENDLSKPIGLSSIGAYSMAVCLIGIIVRMDEFNLPFELPFSIVIFGALVQFYFMIVFIRKCIQTQTWPEPYYNSAIHSCLFPTVALPGNFLATCYCVAKMAFSKIY